MRITLIQPRQNELYDFLHPEKRVPAERVPALVQEMADATFALMEASGPADLVVTTEAVNFPGLTEGTPAALVDDGPLTGRFAAFAKKRHCYVAACLYVLREGRVYNEIILFDRAGSILRRYDKIHLAGSEQATLTPGDHYETVDTDFGRIGLCICWDMQFPEVCRHYALEGARLIVCPTWGWEAIYAHARAYENGVYVAGAMAVPCRGPIDGLRTPSEVVAPDGRVLARAPADRPCALTAEIDLNDLRELHALRMHDRRPDTYATLCEKKGASPC